MRLTWEINATASPVKVWSRFSRIPLAGTKPHFKDAKYLTLLPPMQMKSWGKTCTRKGKKEMLSLGVSSVCCRWIKFSFLNICLTETASNDISQFHDSPLTPYVTCPVTQFTLLIQTLMKGSHRKILLTFLHPPWRFYFHPLPYGREQDYK